MSELHVACSADAAYVPHSAAMLHSVMTRGGDTVMHYLHGRSFPAEARRELDGMVREFGGNLVFHTVDDRRLDELPVVGLFGPAMWYRILLPELLGDLERVLYLDVDTIVLDRLEPLRDVELAETLLGAVRNVFMPYHAHRAQHLGIAPQDYFNSGVLLMNLARMRREGFTDAVHRLVTGAAAGLDWPDQDALNLVVGRRWTALHPRWNCMNSLVYEPDVAGRALGSDLVAEALESPAIRHFEGEGYNKPWSALHVRAGRRLYRSHRRATPWPRYRLADDTPGRKLKRLGGLLA